MRRFLGWIFKSFFFLFLLLAGLAALSYFTRETMPKEAVLRLQLNGPLPEMPAHELTGILRGEMTPAFGEVLEIIKKAAADKRIRGLVLEIDTPQLGVAQLSEFDEAMQVFRDSGKWNAAFVETIGEAGHGDGAYALAVTADKVYLTPPGSVALSGLRTDVPFFKGLLDKIGIQPYVEKRYEYKNAANSITHDKFTPEHRAALKSVIDDLQATLLSHIATRRKVTEAQARAWVEGAPYGSEQALSMGMIDKVAYYGDFLGDIDTALGKDIPFVDLAEYQINFKLPHDAPKIALMIAEGEVVRGEATNDPLEDSAMIASTTMSDAFADARESEVAGVLLRIDSPGGSYVASDLIRDEVERTRKKGIPVVVSMGNVAASGGYFIAMNADRIIAEPGTITGSIGVFSGAFAVREALQKWLGITFDSYEAIPHPGTLNWLDPPSAQDKARLNQEMDRIYLDFVSKVGQARKKTLAEMDTLARGRIWSGKAALQVGLVDELGGMHTAMTRLKELAKIDSQEEVDVVVYPEPPSPLEMLAHMFHRRVQILSEMTRVQTQLKRMTHSEHNELFAPDAAGAVP